MTRVAVTHTRTHHYRTTHHSYQQHSHGKQQLHINKLRKYSTKQKSGVIKEVFAPLTVPGITKHRPHHCGSPYSLTHQLTALAHQIVFRVRRDRPSSLAFLIAAPLFYKISLRNFQLAMRMITIGVSVSVGSIDARLIDFLLLSLTQLMRGQGDIEGGGRQDNIRDITDNAAAVRRY